jgi:hypothetical protein
MVVDVSPSKTSRYEYEVSVLYLKLYFLSDTGTEPCSIGAWGAQPNAVVPINNTNHPLGECVNRFANIEYPTLKGDLPQTDANTPMTKIVSLHGSRNYKQATPIRCTRGSQLPNNI